VGRESLYWRKALFGGAHGAVLKSLRAGCICGHVPVQTLISIPPTVKSRWRFFLSDGHDSPSAPIVKRGCHCHATRLLEGAEVTILVDKIGPCLPAKNSK